MIQRPMHAARKHLVSLAIASAATLFPPAVCTAAQQAPSSPRMGQQMQQTGPHQPNALATPPATQQAPQLEQLLEHAYHAAIASRHHEAKEAYESILRHDPTSRDALANLSAIHYLQGNHGQAMEYVDKALALDPTRPSLLHNKALILASQGNHSQALQLLEAADQSSTDYLLRAAIRKTMTRLAAPQQPQALQPQSHDQTTAAPHAPQSKVAAKQDAPPLLPESQPQVTAPGESSVALDSLTKVPPSIPEPITIPVPEPLTIRLPEPIVVPKTILEIPKAIKVPQLEPVKIQETLKAYEAVRKLPELPKPIPLEDLKVKLPQEWQKPVLLPESLKSLTPAPQHYLELTAEEKQYFPLAEGNTWTYIRTVMKDPHFFFLLDGTKGETQTIKNQFRIGILPAKECQTVSEETYTIGPKVDSWRWAVSIEGKNPRDGRYASSLITPKRDSPLLWGITGFLAMEYQPVSWIDSPNAGIPIKQTYEGLFIRELAVLRNSAMYTSATEEDVVPQRALGTRLTNERIQVPAGTFTDPLNCMTMTFCTNVNDVIHNNAAPEFGGLITGDTRLLNMFYSFTESWYAKGIGLVKEVQHDANSDITYRLELKSYAVK